MNDDIKMVVKTFFDKYPLARYDKSEVLLRPEEALKNVFYLVEGQVAEYDISSAGNEVIVNVFKPGAFFPMSQAINQKPSEYFFETTMPVKMREAPAEDVVAFLKENPKVAFDLLSRVYHGTDGLLRRMAHLMGGKAQSRLVFELLNAAARFGEKQTGDSVFIPLTENDISKRSGLSRETISRAMRQLKKEELVEIQAGGIFIPSREALEDVIGSEL